MLPKSIRWRWQLWLAFLLVCVLSGFGVAVYQLQRVNQLSQIDDELEQRVAAVSSAVRGPPPEFGPGRPPFGRRGGEPGFEEGGRRPPFPPPRGRPEGPFIEGRPPMRPGPREIHLRPDVADLFDETHTNAFYYAIWAWDGVALARSTNSPSDLPRPARRDRDTQVHNRTRGSFQEAYQFTEIGECVLAGRLIADDLAAMGRFRLLLIAAGGAVLVFALGVGAWLTARAIRPVEEISAAAKRISAGNLAERIRVDEPDNELGRLAEVLNSAFSRLESAFARQKQFTADASHELRTPLAILIAEAQTTLSRARSSDEYREAVAACLETAQQMRRLTDSLLELARFDAGQERIARAPLDLADCVRASVDRLRPLAAERGIRIECDLATAEIVGDSERLRQVITNLVTNAIYHNRPDGEVRLGTRLEDGAAILTVSDTGPGISAEDLPRLFERFYRADQSRSRAEGRSGLGLAICKAIVEAHGGSIEASSQPGAGATFTVRLSAKP